MKLNILALGLCLFSVACSTVAIKQPIKVENINNLTLDWCVISTSNMNIIDKTLSVNENKNQFDKRIKTAIDDIEQHFLSRYPATGLPARQQINDCDGKPLNGLDPSSLYLTLDLTGYGSIEEKWKKVLIGTGAVEAVFQGVFVMSLTQNPWLAFAVAAEEMTSEYLTWNGVDWILGDTYAPVTLEGQLSYQTRVIWQDSYFVTENEHELAKSERKDKQKQLLASLHKTESKLFDSLIDYMSTEVARHGINE